MSVTSPRTLDAALLALAADHADAPPRLLAGGTDLMVEFRTGRTRAHNVVNLWGVDALRGIRPEPGGVRFGALTTCADLLRSNVVREQFDILQLAADEVGAEQIKQRATLGGNLGTASPAADLSPVLLALEATVRLRSLRATRDIPLSHFFVGYRQTARAADELIDSIWIPTRPADERRGFRKIGTRRAQSISKVVLALAVRVEANTITSVCGSAGSVAERTVLLPTLSAQLNGHAPTPAALDAAARACAQTDVAPIDDVRSTGDYRRWTVYRVLRSLLETLYLRP